MNYLNVNGSPVSTSQRKTRSLFNWLAKITGVEACWIEGVNSEDKPVWAFIKRLAKTSMLFVRSSMFRKAIATSMLIVPLFIVPAKSVAQPSVNLSTLLGTNGSTFTGTGSNTVSGTAVASGDVNNDGYNDLIIGAPKVDGTIANVFDSGATYVIFGSSSGFGDSFNLSSLDGSTGFVLRAKSPFEISGSALSTGDVNGDGIDDLMIGAPSASTAGKTYVVFGKSSIGGTASIELSDIMDGTNGFVLNGIDGNDRSGGSLASKDINGDSIDDIIIGSNDLNESYVLFGKSSFTGSSSINLSSLDGSTGFILSDTGTSSVVGAGDINGDGIDDVIIGNRGASPNGKSIAGKSYVVFGKSSFVGSSLIELSLLDGNTGFVLNGIDNGDLSGSAVASGDINGDNIDDVIIGAPRADPNSSDSGESYVVFGKSSFAGSSVIELSSLDGSTGFTLNGIVAYQSGSSLAIGDINNDTIDDLIIGAPFGTNPIGVGNAGATYIVFGKSSFGGSSVIELSSLDDNTGFVLSGFDIGGNSGSAVTAVDVNGDSIDDIITGAPDATSSGQTYVFFNSVSQFITGNEGFRTLSAPVSGTLYDELLGPFFTQGFTGSDGEIADDNVWTFDQATQTFVGLSNQATDNLAAGNGFLFFAFSDDNGPHIAGDAGFPKRLSAIQFGGNNTANSGTVSPVSNLNDSDFYFAGNPYGFTIDWDEADITKTNLSNTIYIYDDANSVWQTWNGTTGNIADGLIDPFQGFFIQGSGGSGILEMTEGAIATTGGAFFKNSSKEPSILKITASAGEFESDAWLSFQEGGEMGKDRYDGLYLQPLGNKYLRLATITSTQDLLKINALPLDQKEEFVLPIDLSGTIDELTAKLSFEGLEEFEGWNIVIRDDETGEIYPIEEESIIELDIASINVKEVPSLIIPAPTPKKVAVTSVRYQVVLTPVTQVGIEDPGFGLPARVALDQNYPNPFNPSTNINFAVPEQAVVRLEVFDMLGRKVAELLNEPKSAGRYSVNFDASQLSSGLYLYRLQVGNNILTRKMTLIE